MEGVRLLRDRRAGETLKSETYECGSPPAPRKANNLKRKSTTDKDNEAPILIKLTHCVKMGVMVNLELEVKKRNFRRQ